MAEELGERIHEAVEHAHAHEPGSPLGSTVALLVAPAATFGAITSVTDRNITLRMNQAQAKSIDTWNYYQNLFDLCEAALSAGLRAGARNHLLS